jgi:acyl-CoA reductase-like NAD-dependent aldehyde dehydrogenase
MIARVPSADGEHASTAVDAAARAMRSAIPAFKRAEILDRTAQLIFAREDELAHSLSQEAGKPIKAARVEVARAAGTFTSSAVEARKLAGEVVPFEASAAGVGKLGFTVQVPVGVVGAITPFNFPLNLAAHKTGPALAAGCAVVLKPDKKTPLATLLLAEIMLEAGLPAGWLNVVTGPPEPIGAVLVDDDRVRLITFTGSSDVGWSLRQRAPRKRVTLELGNSTPAIIEPDADLELAATKLTQSAFSFAGQSCISAQRIYAHREVYDQFLASFLPRVEALKVGDPSEEDTDVGPVISTEARERILSRIGQAQAEGARLALGGMAEGNVIWPTVLVDVDPRSRVCSQEVFGPLVSVAPYESFEEALDLANGTEYGLQAGIFTRNLSRAFAAAEMLEFGGVVVNESPTYRTDQMPYGGTKASGNTKEGPAYTIREMTEERLIVIDVG